MPSGWIKIRNPSDLENALARMLNKILTDDDPLIHAGRFASLANSWINCRRLSLDTQELLQLKEEMAELRRLIAESKQHGPIVSLEGR